MNMPNRLIKSVIATPDTFMLASDKLNAEARKFEEAARDNDPEAEGGVSKSIEDAWRENARKLRDLASQL
jgi:hypothetical protein